MIEILWSWKLIDPYCLAVSSWPDAALSVVRTAVASNPTVHTIRDIQRPIFMFLWDVSALLL